MAFADRLMGALDSEWSPSRGAYVSAVLSGVVDGAPVDPVGVVLVTAGAALIALVVLRRNSRRIAPS